MKIKKVHIRYSNLSKQEQLWLKKRAKAHWLTNFVDDLKFLYSLVKERNNSNVIRSIFHYNSTLISQENIAKCFCEHFSTLFNNSQFNLSLHIDLPIGPKISQVQSSSLDSLVSDEEILGALKIINGNKSPSVDGFNSQFFLKSWELTSHTFLKVVHHFFTHSKFSDVFKHSLITLILKSKNMYSVVDFRPIYLYSIFYKIIAKVLASRLKFVLLDIIHNAQFTFLKGRDISNNNMLAHDLCGSLS